MANHASTRSTQLYDRRRDELSLDEVERDLNVKLLAVDAAQRADGEAAPQWSADRQT